MAVLEAQPDTRDDVRRTLREDAAELSARDLVAAVRDLASRSDKPADPSALYLTIESPDGRNCP